MERATHMHDHLSSSSLPLWIAAPIRHLWFIVWACHTCVQREYPFKDVILVKLMVIYKYNTYIILPEFLLKVAVNSTHTAIQGQPHSTPNNRASYTVPPYFSDNCAMSRMQWAPGCAPLL